MNQESIEGTAPPAPGASRFAGATPETALGFQLEALQVRREDWQQRHDVALAAGSSEIAATAARFVRGYNDLIAMIDVSARSRDVTA